MFEYKWYNKAEIELLADCAGVGDFSDNCHTQQSNVTHPNLKWLVVSSHPTETLTCEWDLPGLRTLQIWIVARIQTNNWSQDHNCIFETEYLHQGLIGCKLRSRTKMQLDLFLDFVEHCNYLLMGKAMETIFSEMTTWG